MNLLIAKVDIPTRLLLPSLIKRILFGSKFHGK